MANPYIKLDLDWRSDPKTMLFEARFGRAALADWVSVMCLMGELGGYIALDEPGHRMRARQALGKTDKGIDKLMGELAECRLIDKASWERSRIATSERAVRDADSRARRREFAANASAAAAAKRRAGAEGARTP